MLEAGFPTAIATLYRRAWRPVMMIYGAIGVPVGVVFWLFFRDRPPLHPACNAEEVALIEGTIRGPPARFGSGVALLTQADDRILSANLSKTIRKHCLPRPPRCVKKGRHPAPVNR